MNRNVETVNALYAAFGRGDLPAVLALVAPEVRWGFNVQPDEIPWHRPAHGRDAVGGFFATLAETVAFEAFEPSDTLVGPDSVVVRVHIAFVVRATGKRVEMDQLHLWRFAPTGLVRELTHFEDTAQVAAAAA